MRLSAPELLACLRREPHFDDRLQAGIAHGSISFNGVREWLCGPVELFAPEYALELEQVPEPRQPARPGTGVAQATVWRLYVASHQRARGGQILGVGPAAKLRSFGETPMIADARAPMLRIVRRIDSVRILKSAGSPGRGHAG